MVLHLVNSKFSKFPWEERSSGLRHAPYLRPRFIQSPIKTALSTSAHAPIGPLVVLTWKWPCYRESVSIRSESVITVSEHVESADSESDSDSSETRFQKNLSTRLKDNRRFGGSWHLKSLVLECEVLLLSIRHRIHNLQQGHPGEIMRGLRDEIRGLLRTLGDKVSETKGMIQYRRSNNSWSATWSPQ